MARARTIAIIQARMGSSRFPRKVLADLSGKPVIWHLIHRIAQCTQVDETVVATSDLPADDDLAAYVEGHGIQVVRGSESNVLERLLKAARAAQAEIIVRVTGDAPLVDPASLDAMVSSMVADAADFCIYVQDMPNINEGFEAFTMAALTKLKAEAADDPVAREHTCTYFKHHPGFVKIVHLPVPEELQYRGARMSVDTPSDLQFLNLLHERLNAAPGEIDVRDVVRLLRREPELTRINAAVTQKAAGAVSRTALIRCDASPEIGLGHLVRCLALAEVLRDEQSLGVTFVTRPSEVTAQMIAQHKHRHCVLDEAGDSWVELEELMSRTKPDVLVLDVRDGVSRKTVEDFRRRTGVLMVDIDDPEEKRLACDLVFNPPVSQYAKTDWSSLCGKVFTGWEWVLLRRQFHAAHEERLRQLNSGEGQVAPPVILVTMGGSDPVGMTVTAARALQGIHADFHVIFVLGASFCHEASFQQVAMHLTCSFEVQRNVADMGALMLRADMAVACFSVTAYELATAGVPSVFLSLTDDHYESSLAFEKEGMGISLGRHDRVSEESLIQAISQILMDKAGRLTMTQAALTKTDGLGARRIAGKIIHHLENPS